MSAEADTHGEVITTQSVMFEGSRLCQHAVVPAHQSMHVHMYLLTPQELNQAFSHDAVLGLL